MLIRQSQVKTENAGLELAVVGGVGEWSSGVGEWNRGGKAEDMVLRDTIQHLSKAES